MHIGLDKTANLCYIYKSKTFEDNAFFLGFAYVGMSVFSATGTKEWQALGFGMVPK
jgi:hypothetical protein